VPGGNRPGHSSNLTYYSQVNKPYLLDPLALAQEVVDAIQEALAVCLEEIEQDALGQGLLDVILMALLPVTRSENPKSYQLAQVTALH
jgi:hypothetical protein